MSKNSSSLTQQLKAFSSGDTSSVEALAPMVYRQLRKIAQVQFGRERSGHTLQPTALVNEVFIKLIEAESLKWEDRGHFFSIAAQMMRRILINHAEAKMRIKRGGGAFRVTFNEAEHQPEMNGADLLQLDEALQKLTKKNERQARVVELRYFAGLNIEEIAEALHCSASTVKRDWLYARAWLYRELTKNK